MISNFIFEGRNIQCSIKKGYHFGLPLDKPCIDYSSNGSTVSLIEFHGINLTKVLTTNQEPET